MKLSTRDSVNLLPFLPDLPRPCSITNGVRTLRASGKHKRPEIAPRIGPDSRRGEVRVVLFDENERENRPTSLVRSGAAYFRTGPLRLIPETAPERGRFRPLAIQFAPCFQ